MLEKIKQAWKTALANMGKPWKNFWTTLKTALVSFLTVMGKAIWGLFSAVLESVVAFIKTVGILCFNWLIELIKNM